MDDVKNGAPTPMEIQLMSLAGCSGIDIVNMLKKCGRSSPLLIPR